MAQWLIRPFEPVNGLLGDISALIIINGTCSCID